MSRTPLLLASCVAGALALSAPAPKAALLSAIDTFNAATAIDGTVPIDFGVKGGELDKKSRAPRNLFPDGFDAVSPAVGSAAKGVMAAVDAISGEMSLAATAADTWKTADSPLTGEWSNIFTTAADATFDAKSDRGAAKVSNVVDAKRGRITNVIKFLDPESKANALRVSLTARAVGPQRLELTFRSVKVTFRKRLFGLFRSVYIPFAPATFLARLFFLFRKMKPVTPFFDLLFIDGELRVQRTGEGNVFIQRRLAAAPSPVARWAWSGPVFGK